MEKSIKKESFFSEKGVEMEGLGERDMRKRRLEKKGLREKV